MPTKAELLSENNALKAENATLREQVMVDPLTGLYSRRYLEERLRATQNEAQRQKHTDVFVVFVDVDHFKMLNDRHGHKMGDIVLAGIAERIKKAVRATDIAARYGGEEIVILGRGEGQVVAERGRAAVAEEAIAGVAVTVSVGLSYFNPNAMSDTMTATISRADAAMYSAKRIGRNRVAVAS